MNRKTFVYRHNCVAQLRGAATWRMCGNIEMKMSRSRSIVVWQRPNTMIRKICEAIRVEL